MKKIINCSYTDELGLHNVQWLPCTIGRSRSHTLCKVFRDVKPGPLEMRFGNCHVLSKFDESDVNVKSPKVVVMDHDNAAYIVGTCLTGMKITKCPGKWVCGSLEESLI